MKNISNITRDENRWHQVLGRDASADGQFIYAVSSTGIYCRPSCPSRRPIRNNATFYDLPEAAEAAGFRACMRCKPKNISSIDPQIVLIQQICKLIDSAADDMPTLDHLASKFGISPHHLQRKFKKTMGISPRQFGEARRLERLKMDLKKGQPITSALYGAGFGSSSRLYEKADQYFGMTPASYAKGGDGAEIGYATISSSFGLVLVAATNRGVCFVGIGDTVSELESELAHDFPKAKRVHDDSGMTPIIRHVLAHLEGREPDLNLPVDIRGTAFQWQVWDALRKIPSGETRTYRDLAIDIDHPKAARAVGRACALNPVSLIVPCHRAIGSNGKLTGYRWGVDRKKELLKAEETLHF